VRGFRTCFSELAILLVLLTALLLLAGLLLPTLLLLLAGFLLATLLLAALLLLAGLLVWILVHRIFLSHIWFATSIARFPWQESIRGQCIRSNAHIEAMCLELVRMFRVPLQIRRIDDGTLHASVVAWGADSNSGADLALRRPSLDA
jgi:hypothetical protein